MMSQPSEWAVTVRDRCNITHATHQGTPKGSTFVFDVKFSGKQLNNKCHLLHDKTSILLNGILNNHFHGFDLSTAVTDDGSTCTIEVITKEIWRLLANAQQYDSYMTSLSITTKYNDLISIKYCDMLPILNLEEEDTRINKETSFSSKQWSFCVRNQIRAAHSFEGEQFGPCQNLHGITWIVTVEFSGPNPMFEDHSKGSIIVDEACKLYDLKNLDEQEDFYKCNTTCEVLARQIWLVIANKLLLIKSRGGKNVDREGVHSMKVKVYESDEAFVEYEQSLQALIDEKNAKHLWIQADRASVAAAATSSASAAAAAVVAEQHALTNQDLSGSSWRGSGETGGVTSMMKAKAEANDLAKTSQEATNSANGAHQQALLAAKKADNSRSAAFFRVAVRGRAMVARSLFEAESEERGPLHGNTMVVDAVFTGRELQEEPGYMIDICILTDLVRETVSKVHNENLDDQDVSWRLMGPFSDKASPATTAPTSELLACWIWRCLIANLPPLERSQTSGLRIIVRDGGWGQCEFEAPLWPEDKFYANPDPYLQNKLLTPPVSTMDDRDDENAKNRIPVLLIDFDGCLFHHPQLHNSAKEGGLIASRIHQHCQEYYGLSPEQCDELYSKYGDTLSGLFLSGKFKHGLNPDFLKNTKEMDNKDKKAIDMMKSDMLPTMKLYEAPDGFRGSYDDVLAHEKELGLSGKGGNLFVDNLHSSSSPSSPSSAASFELSSRKLRKSNERKLAELYYSQVYGNIDFDCYLSSNISIKSKKKEKEENQHQPSGIEHNQGLQQLSSLLASLPCPKILCSNSPRDSYIEPFLEQMDDLLNIGWADIVTPMTFLHPKSNRYIEDQEANESDLLLRSEIITKSNPQFYDAILKRFPSDLYQVILFDDSMINLEAAQSAGITPYLVSPKRPLYDAVLEALKCLPSSSPASAVEEEDCSGDTYLNAKQLADENSINQHVRSALVAQLSGRSGAVLRVLDTGAGTLSMLPRVVDMAAAAGCFKVEYCAVEMQSELLSVANKRLVSRHQFKHTPSCATSILGINHLGYFEGEMKSLDDTSSSSTAAAIKVVEVKLTSLVANLTKINEDKLLSSMMKFQSELKQHKEEVLNFDLVVACSFADLLSPSQFAKLMAVLAPGALLYLPITFVGGTKYAPAPTLDPCPGLGHRSLGNRYGGVGRVPGAAVIEQIYHHHLISVEGQYIDNNKLLEELESKGFELSAHGNSNWELQSSDEITMWSAMLKFVSRACPAILYQYGWSPTQWLASIQKGIPVYNENGMITSYKPSSLLVENKDLLLKIPYHNMFLIKNYQVLLMTSPRVVQTEQRVRIKSSIPPQMVEVKTLKTMISNGTELKFFKGEFEESSSEPLDANIKGLSEQAPSYPLEYGYSMVGLVVGCGEHVDASKWLGETVFLFHPHASSALYEASGLITVPPGIDPLDAVFLPAVETALSIVHDAHPRAGERVAVLGQGLIGLLVTRILATMNIEIVTVEVRAGRRRLSKDCGAVASIPPEALLKSGWAEVDVAVEVSGNARALQLAIDCVRPGGKCIIASWYGEGASLNLGTAFHRSHINIIASQVSNLPAAVSMTWSKNRRFDAAWTLLQQIKPGTDLFKTSRLLLPLSQAQLAYESLERGEVTVSLIDYLGSTEQRSLVVGIEGKSRL